MMDVNLFILSFTVPTLLYILWRHHGEFTQYIK